MKHLPLALCLIATPVMAQTVSEKDQQIAELQLQLLAQQLNNLKLKADVEKAQQEVLVDVPVMTEKIETPIEEVNQVPVIDTVIYE